MHLVVCVCVGHLWLLNQTIASSEVWLRLLGGRLKQFTLSLSLSLSLTHTLQTQQMLTLVFFCFVVGLKARDWGDRVESPGTKIKEEKQMDGWIERKKEKEKEKRNHHLLSAKDRNVHALTQQATTVTLCLVMPQGSIFIEPRRRVGNSEEAQKQSCCLHSMFRWHF